MVETYHRGLRDPVALASLGPDLAVAAVDIGAALARARAVDPGTEIAEVLLDQRVAAGIGNVYKSELCFLHGLDPFTPVARSTYWCPTCQPAARTDPA